MRPLALMGCAQRTKCFDTLRPNGVRSGTRPAPAPSRAARFLPLTMRLSKGERSEGAAIPFALSLSKGFAIRSP